MSGDVALGFLLALYLLAGAPASATSWKWIDVVDALAQMPSSRGGNWRDRRQLQDVPALEQGPLLIPLLPYGLSNQLIALKESLALAAVLNWTVVGYGFMPHYSELAAAAGVDSASNTGDPTVEPGGAVVPITAIPFDTLIDRASLAPLVRIITVQEALELLEREGQRHELAGATAGTAGGGAADSSSRDSRARLQRLQQQHRRILGKGSTSSTGNGGHARAPRIGCGGAGGEGVDDDGAGAGGGSVCLAVDRLVLLRDNGMPDTLHKAEEGGRLDASRAHTVRKKFTCDARGLDWFRQTAARDRWRVVALNGYHCVLPQARRGFKAMQLRGGSDSGCWQAYQRVTALMQRSEAVRDAAAAFLDSAAARALLPGDAVDGGSSERGRSNGAPLVPRVLSLHFRPYPDACLDYFVNMTTFELGAAQEVCSQPLLLHQIVPLAQAFLAQWAAEATEVEAEPAAATRGPAVVFVMSHPKVRKTLSREFERLWAAANGSMGDNGGGGRALRLDQTAGAPPLPRLSFLDLDDVPPALFEAPGSSNSGSGSSSSRRALPVGANSILSVVEQQVCAGADVFIGTATSSISVLVAQERVVVREAGTVGVAGAGHEGEEGGVPREEGEEWLQRVVTEAKRGKRAKNLHIAADGRVTVLL
ncbi:hypothetical protein HYH02_006511 [Chlamydomonas schloesseri]|uniref:Uncharacterized protein n=1 Tax=Chlamydomonas schloesseri TaxID=2026947 RepID=A0A835WJW0_9CHLO|nr:hypothetical protein HYH02_006511 [Chlamydomonas schloesseri]|eukprot:KAG2448623.1 hypothetical protein HYH02_006511 [Chlamydomonas schloesseri]